jgi:hypothetical protein
MATTCSSMGERLYLPEEFGYADIRDLPQRIYDK